MAFDQNKPANNGTLASVDMRNNFVHIKNAVGKEHVWDDATPGNTTHRLDQIKATVTSSTQKDPTNGYDYSTTGSAAGIDFVTHTVSGIPANTYTLQSLLQELVNRSHQHTIERRMYSPYCECNCHCSDGSCFVAGTMILMADKTWKAIEKVKTGDRVIGIDGKLNTVLAPYSTKLGNQRSIVRFSDNSLFWSGEHLLWVQSPEGNEYWGTHDYNQYIREKGTYEIEGRVVQYNGLSQKEPLIITNGYRYGHLAGWLDKTVVIDRNYDDETLVYDLVIGGSHTYIVNGYFATGFVNDKDFDFFQDNFIIGKELK